MNEREDDHQSFILNEVQLLLAEKRTSLAAIRTGIAVLILPLSVVSLLIATSKYYDVVHVMPLFAPLLVFCPATSRNWHFSMGMVKQYGRLLNEQEWRELDEKRQEAAGSQD